METLTKTYRAANKDRVTVTVQIGQTATDLPGIDHGTVPAGATTLSFTGEVTPYRGRNVVAAGQVQADVPDNVIRDLWGRWHLNGLRSHCAHQNTAIRWDVVAPCEETGYSAGSAWLFEPVPADVVEAIRAAMQ